MLFDAHTHLNYEEFSEEERLDRAREIEESDVEFIIDVGDSVESSEQAIKDAAEYSWCYAAVGIHPDKALTYSDDDIDKIKELAEEDDRSFSQYINLVLREHIKNLDKSE